MVHAANWVRNFRHVAGDASASVLAFGWGSGSRPVEALPLRLIVSKSLTALCGLVPIPAGLVPDIPHSAVDFAKEVFVRLDFHDEQCTPWSRHWVVSDR